jgi:hypothetical protein
MNGSFPRMIILEAGAEVFSKRQSAFEFARRRQARPFTLLDASESQRCGFRYRQPTDDGSVTKTSIGRGWSIT